jgi:hypothetical protein
MTVGWMYVMEIDRCRRRHKFTTFTRFLYREPGTPQTHEDLNSYKSMLFNITGGEAR